MTTTSIKKTNFTFRSKFKKVINEQNSESIMSAFDKFCTFDEANALDSLWRMTYSEDVASGEITRLGANIAFIPSEKYSTFRNELRVQYQNQFPHFLSMKDIIEECQSEFTALKEATDVIVANIVYQHCISVLSNNVGSMFGNEIDRILFLLNHPENEKYNFGGIRCLYFDMEEANYLKPYHILIHNILLALRTFIKDAPIEIPLYEEGEEEEGSESLQNHKGINFNDNDSIQISNCKTFKELTAKEILEHKEIFKPFAEEEDMNILLVIGKIGFDLNEVIAKKEKIRNLLFAIEELN